MTDKYILRGKEVIPVEDLMEWADYFETADRKIGKDEINGFLVSTIFLGLDHSYGSGPPLLFETMVFGKYPGSTEYKFSELLCERCSTYDEAIIQHEQAVRKVERGEIEAEA